MIALCIILSSFVSTGCTVKYQGISFQNAQSEIREVYIRNAGTQNWGKAIPITNNSIAHIDKSTFTRRVDIKAIDSRGIIYNASNVDISQNGDRIGKTTNAFKDSMDLGNSGNPDVDFQQDAAFYIIYIAILPISIIIDIVLQREVKKQRDAVAVRNE